MIKIITDTSTLYNVEQGKKLDIDVLPLHVTINNKSYKEFIDIKTDTFIDLIKSGHLPSTSQPSIGETIDLFESYPNEEILAICMADGLSGTYQSTVAAKQQTKHKDNIHVLNSKTLCGPHRHLVDVAIKLRKQGKPLHEIKEALHQRISSTRSFLIPQDFSFLERGGRLTPLAAKVGSMLKVIPIMCQTEDGTRLEKFGIKRTMKAAVDSIIKDFKSRGIDDSYIIYVSHAGVLKQADAIVKQIQEKFDNITISILELSPAFIGQGGPGCIAIQTILK